MYPSIAEVYRPKCQRVRPTLRRLRRAAAYRRVSPGVWQREFNLPTIKAAGSSTKKKNEHKARAQELFPQFNMTHAIADALLIAEWGRRQYLK